ncbi:CYTH domain-containing protein [Nitrococcus mobilis]|uniref:CYTH domain-containing protein n=1 Tax=Nitrococcus mobilis TaxID=35797 RepID=UPI0002FEF94C|nr:CYTH domain-containing protein [Nitrococcus mobilis]
MATEIERKFLVIADDWQRDADAGTTYRQGYLIGCSTSSVRVRLAGEQAWLNIKSGTMTISRREYDYPIPARDATEMLAELCRKPLIEKIRYRVRVGAHVWEVDCFQGENAGLVVAEIELTDPQERFTVPVWAGHEVSDRLRYYNVNLVDYPYRDWTEAERAGF